MHRHDMIFVSPLAWRSLLEGRSDLGANPLVARWVDRGWPLIGRRAVHGEGQGVPVGLPLPPFAGKHRHSFLVRRQDIVSTCSPPVLKHAVRVAPYAWRPTLNALTDFATRYALEARVFGSLAWAAVTGLDYLTESSDLDLLLPVQRDTDLVGLTAELASIDDAAPMRVDGELIRSDGVATSWREFHSGSRQILVKTMADVTLLDRMLFFNSGSAS
ncbi:malonate decarboxylase holo-[acyl-carrier-protein] synthase [Mesorhizobium sp. LNHC232B00]|uniref:malonate decarboxylase holo-[acyl-carrier-protein] synthase n=2 Tax=Mesorhizobium TaxID=68287 RepID=UPI0004CF0D84|nr:malonate decarboxylase holo-[acyl-carrier-protein] synthase [Mesorhizobium sp. LNHC232B00]